MLYMVVERYVAGPRPVYERAVTHGRMLPEGLEYVSSWIDVDLKICWQLMRTEDESLFQIWTDNWKDLMDFKVVPVRTSAEMRQMMDAKLD